VKALIAVAAISAGCDRRAPITSCDQDLTGAYTTDGKRWMVIDRRVTLEAYPLFPDVPEVSGLELAPRAIDLVRDDSGIAGHVKRRYMRGTAICNARVPARITACAGDALEIVLADPVPPVQFAGRLTIEVEPPTAEAVHTVELFGLFFTRPLCKFPRPDSNRRERWHRD